MEEYIYLDNAATTFPKPEAVYQALDRANRNAAVNAGRGSYALAEQAKQLIEDTRGLLLTLTTRLCVPCIFYSNAMVLR